MLVDSAPGTGTPVVLLMPRDDGDEPLDGADEPDPGIDERRLSGARG